MKTSKQRRPKWHAKWGAVKAKVAAMQIGSPAIAESVRERDSMRDAAVRLGLTIKSRVIRPEKTGYAVTLLPPKSA